jgi:hypothetical protein
MHKPFSALLGQCGSLLLSLRAVDNLILNKNTKGEPKQISCGAHEAVSTARVLGTHRALPYIKEVLVRGTGSLSSEEQGTCQDNRRKPASEGTHQLSSTKLGAHAKQSQALRGSHSLLCKEPESG